MVRVVRLASRRVQEIAEAEGLDLGGEEGDSRPKLQEFAKIRDRLQNGEGIGAMHGANDWHASLGPRSRACSSVPSSTGQSTSARATSEIGPSILSRLPRSIRNLATISMRFSNVSCRSRWSSAAAAVAISVS